MCSLMGAVSAYSESGKLGDIDGDGKILSSDARAILRHSARLELLEGDALSNADVNFDGNVTSADARIVLRVSAKLQEMPEKGSDTGTEPTTEKDVETTLEDNMQIAKDVPCPYCGKIDCVTVSFDPKLGISIHDPSKAELCPEYKPAEETIEEPITPIPDPCEICGFLVGHLPECPNYSIYTDPVYYCQTCHFPVGIGLDKCDMFVCDTVCPHCEQYVKAWECHHCPGTK